MTQKKYNIRQASSEKVTRYAIKRLSVGVVSVAVAASFMVLNQNQVAAQTNDGVTTTETGEIQIRPLKVKTLHKTWMEQVQTKQ